MRFTLEAVLAEPMQAAHVLMNMDCIRHMSSLELSRRTGVPSSNIRALRSGVPEDMKVSNWARLMVALMAVVNEEQAKRVEPGRRRGKKKAA